MAGARPARLQTDSPALVHGTGSPMPLQESTQGTERPGPGEDLVSDLPAASFLACRAFFCHPAAQYVHLCTLSCLTLCDPWTIACQAPLSMEFTRQEYWSGLSFHSPRVPDPGIELASLASPTLAGGFCATSNSPTRDGTYDPCSGSMES